MSGPDDHRGAGPEREHEVRGALGIDPERLDALLAGAPPRDAEEREVLLLAATLRREAGDPPEDLRARVLARARSGPGASSPRRTGGGVRGRPALFGGLAAALVAAAVAAPLVLRDGAPVRVPAETEAQADGGGAAPPGVAPVEAATDSWEDAPPVAAPAPQVAPRGDPEASAAEGRVVVPVTVAADAGADDLARRADAALAALEGAGGAPVSSAVVDAPGGGVAWELRA
ncbi:MAG TPA: hypothetical protein VNT51_13850, partial [Miltoncostaeaceae bacterium]|nr:hypothetical protein [Miltoncostaeaceae bacterium]